MVDKKIAKLRLFFQKNDERTQNILINTFLSFGVKGGSILVGLLLVPMTIDYVNPVQYGIWLTISSVVGWMGFFDIGMGHGLRNKLTECLAHNNFEDAKMYVSTTYAVLVIIGLILFVLLFYVNSVVDWNLFLRIPASVTVDISLLVLLVFGAFCIQFVVQLINTILLASQQSAKSAFIGFLGQLLVLVAVFITKKNIPSNLIYLVSLLTFIPILVLFISSIILFRTVLIQVSPSFRYIKFQYSTNVLGLGWVFFVLQLGAIVLFQTDNIIISKVIGPESVTLFNVSYKLFSVVILLFSVIVVPYWSAFTDAFASGDFTWMKLSTKKIRKIALLFSLITILILIFSSDIYSIWLGSLVHIDKKVSLAMAFYVVTYVWLNTHIYFLNGVGKLRIQLIVMLLSVLVNIPLAFFWGKEYGVSGVIWANVLVNTIMNIVLFVQVEWILNRRAFGIWNK